MPSDYFDPGMVLFGVLASVRSVMHVVCANACSLSLLLASVCVSLSMLFDDDCFGLMLEGRHLYSIVDKQAIQLVLSRTP